MSHLPLAAHQFLFLSSNAPHCVRLVVASAKLCLPRISLDSEIVDQSRGSCKTFNSSSSSARERRTKASRMDDASGASKKREQELRKIVLSWLSKKGYSSAAEQFSKDANIIPDEGGSEALEEFAFRRGMTADFCVKNYILQWGMEDMQPSRYEESYIELRDWCMKLLDDHKCEISELLYPIFMHCFFELVSKQYVTEAKDLVSRHRHDHEPEHSDEIESLSSITDAQHLETHPVVKRYLKNSKFRVWLCHESDRALTEFLHNKRLFIIVRIMNQRLDVVIYGNTVHDISPAVRVPLEAPATSRGQAPPHKKFRFGVCEDHLAARKSAAAAAAAAAAASGGGGSGGSEGVAMPGVTEEEEVKLLEDAKRRVRLSASALPSVCFHTFFNSKETMCSVDIARDAGAMCAGFSDSRVRMWDLRKDESLRESAIGADDGGVDSTLERGVSMTGHSAAVYATSLSPDSKFTLSCSGDSSVRLWDVTSGDNVVTYKGHNFPVWDVCFSPLGHYFATASHDRTARLWCTESVFPLRVMPGHMSDVDCVTFHPNCNYIATGSLDRTCRMWDIADGGCVRLFKGHSSPVTAVAVSACGKMLAAGSDSGEVLVWDIGTSKCLHTLTGNTGAIFSLDFSRGDSGLLASGGQDGVIRLWEVGAGAAAKETCLPTRQATVQRVKFSRTNLLLAAGAYIPSKK